MNQKAAISKPYKLNTFIQTPFLYSLLLVFFPMLLHAEGYIEGQIKIDSTWEQKAYLSYIKDFGALYSMSNEMILDESDLDSDGNLSFDLTYLSKEEKIYRIHFVKKGDSPATLIIGGNEENHSFVIANSSSRIRLKNIRLNELSNLIIENSPLNTSFHSLLKIRNEIDSLVFTRSTIKREFLQLAIYEKYRFIADTCSNPLLSLYSIYQSDYESNYSLNKEFYDSYNKKWKKNKSSYFAKFREDLSDNDDPKISKYIVLAISFLLIGIILGNGRKYIALKRNIQSRLTVQERKILALLKEGLTNQEISDKCNIGISTVKSHISNIYSKLKINSRKEALDIKLEC